MENREFISAANLPVAEGEEVSVLCLENGEMKQKPAKGLGGGSGTMVVINTTFIDYNGERDPEYTVSHVPTGTFELIKNGLLSGAPVMGYEICNSKWISIELNEEQSWIDCMLVRLQYNFESAGYPETISLVCYNQDFVLLSDDTITTWEELDQEMGG